MQLTPNYRLMKPDGTDPVTVQDLNGNMDVLDTEVAKKMDKTGDASNVVNAFAQAGTRANLSSGEKLSISLGKIMKWFSDLKTVAFSGKYSDLTDRPTIPAGGIADASKIIDNIDDIAANTQAGYMAGALALKQVNSDLGGFAFKEEAGKKYVRGADAVWVPLGSNPYIMGSERMENNIFVPSLESHNRNPTSIAPSTYCTITQAVDLTYINKIIIKIHVTNNTSSTVCKFGLGVRTAQPKSYADCEGTATKIIWTHGPTAGNLAQIIEYDVAGLTGNYYPFAYHNFPYEIGIFYWKVD